MTLRLVYLARLAEAFGRKGETIEVPDTVNSVIALTSWLASRGGAWAEELDPRKTFRVAINHDLATAHTPLAAGDEVAYFPPVTGG